MAIIWMVLLVLFGVIFFTLLGVKLYLKWRLGICTSTADLSGKTVIVTGANTGIGYYTALDLARRNARVILGCRSQERGQAAVDRIIAATNNNNVCVKVVDLSVMKSVRQFADDIMKHEDRLDVLVNNAGLSGLPKLTLTEEGLEEQFACNHLGPFLLTNLLLGVDVYCVHPGPVHTELYRHLPHVLDFIYRYMIRFSFKTAEEGAQTSIYCAVSEEVTGQSGKYYQDCREAEGDSSEQSKDMGLAKKLWEVSERMTGLVEDKAE